MKNAKEVYGGHTGWWGLARAVHRMRETGVVRRSPLKVIGGLDGLVRKKQLER